MSTNTIIALKMLPGIMGIASIIAAAFFALFVFKSSKKYQAYTLQLKERSF